ncbi:15093_t:CDS:2 [Funneliformis caledonium]|uniref:15093_t:CDS:1 n=1 Tax=Funneliformis caledonium TaxID=1117310 RepID=A0A9N9IE36_9GLOM|nr:15093_t:CDS:2 [Funneliformis caledonium]
MPRQKKTCINKNHSKVTNIKPRTRNLIKCKCLLHCNESPSIKEREKKIVVEAVEEDRNSLNNSFSDSESILEQVSIEESSDEECFEIPPGDEESSSTNDVRDLSEDDLSFEQFIAPDLDDLEFEPDHEYPSTNINFDDS